MAFGILVFFASTLYSAVFFSSDYRANVHANSYVQPNILPQPADTPKPAPLSARQYAPNNIVFLLDISHSMSKDKKMELLQKSMSVLLERLRPVDRVSLITFGNYTNLLYSTMSFTGPDSLKKILTHVRSIATATNVNGGVEDAYEKAKAAFIKQANNEVLLITDGEFVLNKHTIELVKNSPEVAMTCVIIGTDLGAVKAAEYVKNTLQLNLVTLVNEGSDLNVLLENIKSRASLEVKPGAGLH